jgi:acetyl-CoA C-acetyltransferase/acetyl-CoA acyltransferase
MLDTAEIVAKRYDISRERQTSTSESQRRTASAQQGGRFNDELVRSTTMAVTDKATGVSYRQVTLDG